jgi:hypothetical protein
MDKTDGDRLGSAVWCDYQARQRLGTWWLPARRGSWSCSTRLPAAGHRLQSRSASWYAASAAAPQVAGIGGHGYVTGECAGEGKWRIASRSAPRVRAANEQCSGRDGSTPESFRCSIVARLDQERGPRLGEDHRRNCESTIKRTKTKTTAEESNARATGKYRTYHQNLSNSVWTFIAISKPVSEHPTGRLCTTIRWLYIL